MNVGCSFTFKKLCVEFEYKCLYMYSQLRFLRFLGKTHIKKGGQTTKRGGGAVGGKPPYPISKKTCVSSLITWTSKNIYIIFFFSLCEKKDQGYSYYDSSHQSCLKCFDQPVGTHTYACQKTHLIGNICEKPGKLKKV